jgi:glutathione S-transferase
VHGSGLNTADIALAVLARQCLNRRRPEVTSMAPAVAAWEARRTGHRATIEWRFRTEDACMKLKSLYPKELL